MAQADRSLLAGPQSKFMLDICSSRTGDHHHQQQQQPNEKVVEMNESGGFDLSESAEPSLMQQMVAEGEAARTAMMERKQADETARNKTFGSGLKKGFLSAASQAKEHKAKRIIRPTNRDPPGVRDKIQQEVSANLLAEHTTQWLTPDLLDEIKKRPSLSKVFDDPKYASALELLKRDPKRAVEAFSQTPELRDFVREFCTLMGGHFEKLDQSTRADIGPLARAAVEKAERGDMPSSTPHEQAHVDRIVKDPELSKLLMEPDTQHLMQRCADPVEFTKAIRDPHNAAIIRKLADAGLVQIQA